MKTSVSLVKVRYGETDQMGVVHHGNYAQYLELARIEWLRELGISYKTMESEGIMLPVYEMQLKYKTPATFDDELRIITKLKELPNVKIKFEYEIYNQEEKLITTASTVLVFLDAKTKRPVRCPQYILAKLNF